MNDVDKPMGNAELRLTLAGLESEVGDIKDIALDTRDQARKTNGRVNILEKFQYGALVGFSILTPITGWLVIDYMQHRNDIENQVTPAMVQAAVNQAFEEQIKQ